MIPSWEIYTIIIEIKLRLNLSTQVSEFSIHVLSENLFCRKTNIFDNVVYMMEKYADNLEDLVSERTAQLVEEKKKTDALLDRILPR